MGTQSIFCAYLKLSDGFQLINIFNSHIFLIEFGVQEEANTSKKDLLASRSLSSSGRNKSRLTLKQENKMADH